MINQCFLYLPLDGGGREGLGAVVVVVVVVVVVAGPAVFMRNDSIIFIMINMTQSYDKSLIHQKIIWNVYTYQE